MRHLRIHRINAATLRTQSCAKEKISAILRVLCASALKLVVFRTDGGFQIFESTDGKLLAHAANDIAGKAWSFINQSGVSLHERSAGDDFFPGIVRAENTTNTDDGHLAIRLPIQVTNNLRAADAQRFTAQAAGFSVNLLQRDVISLWTHDGRIGRHNAGDVPWFDEFENFVQRLKAQVRR